MSARTVEDKYYAMGAMTLNIMTCSIMTVGIFTLSVTIKNASRSIMMLYIMTLLLIC